MHFMCFNDIEALRFPSASTDTDVCVDRCATKKCEVCTQRVAVFDHKRR